MGRRPRKPVALWRLKAAREFSPPPQAGLCIREWPQAAAIATVRRPPPRPPIAAGTTAASGGSTGELRNLYDASGHALLEWRHRPTP